MSDTNEDQTPQNDETTARTSEATAASDIQEPPTSFGGIFRKLGPGLIIAASIVGSGELIATTKTGAQAGISLLWLVIVGCVIKVFVQVELGRVAISQGETTLTSLNRIPGPRLGVSWIIWYWLMATRPSSICTKTLITQPTTISHSNEIPACAPVFVVAINSPDPTILAAIISPGPSFRKIPPNDVGGS